MGRTVFAENMGLFHKGSGGKGVAPADVCLSPPPPPTGPVPVPYVNNLSASDLAKGSTKVKIQGEPTCLEDASESRQAWAMKPARKAATSSLIRPKGKGYFTLWSFTVKIEGKGVCRHGDMMGQNCASSPSWVRGYDGDGYIRQSTRPGHRHALRPIPWKQVPHRGATECVPERSLLAVHRRDVRIPCPEIAIAKVQGIQGGHTLYP